MRCCTLIGLAICFSAALGQENAAKEEMKKLQGRWAQVRLEADGRTHDDEKSPKVTLTISGETWLDGPAGEADGADPWTFKINPAKNPKQIDLIEKIDGGKTQTYPGIYTWEGDALKVAIPYPFEGDTRNINKRPTEFRTKPDDDFVVITYKRIKS
jgi:uncharacterized protein (TIGR03067 family)